MANKSKLSNSKKPDIIQVLEESKSAIVAPIQEDFGLLESPIPPLKQQSAIESPSGFLSVNNQLPDKELVVGRIDLIESGSSSKIDSSVKSPDISASNIKEFTLEISDIESNHYRLRVSEIDTIRDVKAKL